QHPQHHLHQQQPHYQRPQHPKQQHPQHRLHQQQPHYQQL
ncbi:unnamed protein product, partial [Rotaria sp. Silwood2]